MAFYFASEKNKREINEDSYCQMELRINLEASISAMVVADGMGGLAGGKFYSETALELWYRGLLDTMMGEGFRDCSLHQQIDALTEFSENIFEKINRQLYKKGLDTGARGGTTLSAAIHFWDAGRCPAVLSGRLKPWGRPQRASCGRRQALKTSIWSSSAFSAIPAVIRAPGP